MPKKDATKELVISQIEEKEREIALLQAQVDALKGIINQADGLIPATVKPRVNVKATVLKLLEEVGEQGLTGRTAVELAKSRGVELNPKSVTSILSRLASDDVIWYDQQVYRENKFKPKPAMPAPTAPTVVQNPRRVVSLPSGVSKG